MRILVTGSRDWSDVITVGMALLRYAREGNTLVHGDCPTGADRIAHEWWMMRATVIPNLTEPERYPAVWKLHGKSAGFRRNAEMVATKPDLCLAFRKNNSKGTSHTIKLCQEKGIPVKIYEA